MPDEPVGSVVAFAGEIADTGGVVEVPAAGSGWLLCNGAAVRSSRFPQLFAAIRAAHGNGSDDPNPQTDFNLPDLRGLKRDWILTHYLIRNNVPLAVAYSDEDLPLIVFDILQSIILTIYSSSRMELCLRGLKF